MEKQKKLSIFAIAMMNVVIVANLQMMTATATYGYSLIFLYLIAALSFFLPCMLIITELSTAHPTTGGSYVWVEKAFGKRWGFFAACLVWLSNVIWYPTIFSLLATLIAYLASPDLANSTAYTIGGAIFLFWCVTLLNTFGIRISSFVSTLSSLSGVIFPTLSLIGFGLFWVADGKPSQIQFSWNQLIPDFRDSSHLAFLTQIVISLIGIEMAVVHAGDIKNPKTAIPKAMGISAILILLIVILAPISMSLVIPESKIGIVAGLIDALEIFFQSFQIPSFVFLGLLALVFLGNLGSTTGWMIGSTRGMQVASIHCEMPSFMQKKNRYNAPLGILLFEAMIFTISCSLFFFSTISNSYWILLQLASQISLLYYLLIFAAAIKLKKEIAHETGSFKVPFGTKGTTFLALLASATALLAVILGLFPPSNGTVNLGALYPLLMILGIAVCLFIPFLFLKLARK